MSKRGFGIDSWCPSLENLNSQSIKRGPLSWRSHDQFFYYFLFLEPLLLLLLSSSFRSTLALECLRCLKEEKKISYRCCLQASTSKFLICTSLHVDLHVEARQLYVAMSNLRNTFFNHWIRGDQDQICLIMISNLF